jgi:hypothetical protein
VQTELTDPSPLLDSSGNLNQIGWSRHPILDCNLENAHFYKLRPLQFLRIKRWDYYGVFTPQRFFSATIADLGYAGNIFVYTVDFETGEVHEEGLVIPLGKGVHLARNSTSEASICQGKDAQLSFKVSTGKRSLSISWPQFHDGRGIEAEIAFRCPLDHESMNIVIPIGEKRFYFNRKINCLPAEGSLRYGEVHEQLNPDETLGSLDWGRGVWEYSSFWNWASASGFMQDGRAVGLNLGRGFGDTSAATENCLVLEGRIHKLDQVEFTYDSKDYMKPWKFNDSQNRLELSFTPFSERVARTNLGLIVSEVHQLFGQYSGKAVTDDGETLQIEGLIGFAEDHHAKW